MLSFQILTRQSGSPVWMDRCEELAFNMLPASYDSEQKSLHYVTSMNIAQIDNTVKGSDFDNPWAMQAFMPGVHNYRCCPHNYGLAWPYFAEKLWHATTDNGLAANLCAASKVTAKGGSAGTVITLTQTTEYPFGDTGGGQCQVPKSWRLTCRRNGEWVPVAGASAYGTAPDKCNVASFTPVTASAFQVEVQLQDGFSGGILRWRLE